MTRKVIELWQCGDCDQEYDDEHDALYCCAPTPVEVYGCPDCKESHKTELAALACCDKTEAAVCPNCRRDYPSDHINALAIEFAGHCNTCNPHFTHEQQFTIEHLIEQAQPWNEQRLR